MNSMPMKIVHIAGCTDVKQAAATVAALVRLGRAVELEATGQAAACTALQAITQANRWLAPAGLHFAVSPRYERLVRIDGTQVAIRMPIAARPDRAAAAIEPKGAGETELLLVSATSDPGRVAGAIAGSLKAGARPVLQAIGQDATYAAVKALVVAGRYLAEVNTALEAVPEIAGIELQGAVRQAVRMRIAALPAAAVPQGGREDAGRLLLVCAGSLPGDVCGALAGYVREGRRVELQALGPDAALLAVRILATAAGFLAQAGISIATAPYLAELTIDGAPEAALRFPVTACPAAGDGEAEAPAASSSPIRAAASSAPPAVAGAIAHRIRDGERVEVRAFGAQAVCVALHAIVTARRYLANQGIAIATAPGWATETRDGVEVSSLRFPITAWSAAQDAGADD